MFMDATRSTVGNVSNLTSPRMTPINETTVLERRTNKPRGATMVSLNNSKVYTMKP